MGYFFPQKKMNTGIIGVIGGIGFVAILFHYRDSYWKKLLEKAFRIVLHIYLFVSQKDSTIMSCLCIFSG